MKRRYLVVNIVGNYYATSNICSHEGARLHEGILKGKELRCQWHGTKWDVVILKSV